MVGDGSGIRGEIYLYGRPADMRKSFDGLMNIVESELGEDILRGSLFVFVNRRKTLVKVLYWDGDGVVIWSKRLERGTFRVSWSGHTELSRREFMMLLEGIEPKRLYMRYDIKR